MARGQQQQQGPDNAYAPAWIMGAMFFVGLLVWYFFHTYIVTAVFHVRLLEVHLIHFFTSSVDRLSPFLKRPDTADVTFEQVVAISEAVGHYLRYPVLAVLAALGILLYFSDATLRFRKTYSMQSLRDAEHGNWPQIHPVLKLDLVNTPINEGPWAMSITPLDFAKKHNLVRKELAESKHKLLKRRREHVATLRRGEARKFFNLQLGPYWEGPDSLPRHCKALLAIFMAKHNRDRDAATQLLDQINRSTNEGQLNLVGTEALLKKHFDTPKLQKTISHHAYVLTVMAAMINAAREDGVLPTAEFLWLKPIDRPLWYMLNSIGRQTPFAEVSGPFAHWLAEKELERKIMVPMVNEAVVALEKSLKEIKLRPDEEV